MLYKGFLAALTEATSSSFSNGDLLAHFVTYFLKLTFKLQFIIDRYTQKLYLLYLLLVPSHLKAGSRDVFLIIIALYLS